MGYQMSEYHLDFEYITAGMFAGLISADFSAMGILNFDPLIGKKV